MCAFSVAGKGSETSPVNGYGIDKSWREKCNLPKFDKVPGFKISRWIVWSDNWKLPKDNMSHAETGATKYGSNILQQSIQHVMQRCCFPWANFPFGRKALPFSAFSGGWRSGRPGRKPGAAGPDPMTERSPPSPYSNGDLVPSVPRHPHHPAQLRSARIPPDAGFIQQST